MLLLPRSAAWLFLLAMRSSASLENETEYVRRSYRGEKRALQAVGFVPEDFSVKTEAAALQPRYPGIEKVPDFMPGPPEVDKVAEHPSKGTAIVADFVPPASAVFRSPSGRGNGKRGSRKGRKGKKRGESSDSDESGSTGSTSSTGSSTSKGSRSSKRSKGSKSRKSSKRGSTTVVLTAFALCYEAPLLTLEPTEDELDDLLDATTEFYSGYLEESFQFYKYRFEELHLVIGETTFEPGFFCAEYIGKATFEGVAPTPEKLADTLSEAPLDEYITEFVEELDSGLQSTEDVDFLDFFEAEPTPAPSSLSVEPTETPTQTPTGTPMPTISRSPTPAPSAQPTINPTGSPSSEPSPPPVDGTLEPSSSPSQLPSVHPSNPPSRFPSPSPIIGTLEPSSSPSEQPSLSPSQFPSPAPIIGTLEPSSSPSELPSQGPSQEPSQMPSQDTSQQPSQAPSEAPSQLPSAEPSQIPSLAPSTMPSRQPSSDPSQAPSGVPSLIPSSEPSLAPSSGPSQVPSLSSQPSLSVAPSMAPSNSAQPTLSSAPSLQPSAVPSQQPSQMPSLVVSQGPSNQPSIQPSTFPSALPSQVPSLLPSSMPSIQPSLLPSLAPSQPPSNNVPLVGAELSPTIPPMGTPSSAPSSAPSSPPSSSPSSAPSSAPTPFIVDFDMQNVSAIFQPTFVAAAKRWQDVIVGDLDPSYVSDAIRDMSACSNLPEVIDDVHVCISVAPNDGEYGVIGVARPEMIRRNGLPTIGLMQFDSDDIVRLKREGLLQKTILREMGHVLGLGTLWVALGLANSTTPSCSYGEDTVASHQYRNVSRCAGAIPLEQESGQACASWDHDCFPSELMAGGTALSPVTLGGLEDIGYEVDYTQADPLLASDLDPQCVCSTPVMEEPTMYKVSDLFPGLSIGTKYAHHVRNRDQKPMKPPNRQLLSTRGRRLAMEYGKRLLRAEANKRRPATDNPEDSIFVGDRFVRVLYAEAGETHAVEVWDDDAFRL